MINATLYNFLIENLNNIHKEIIHLAYGLYYFKRPRHKDLIIRGFTVYPTQVGVEQNFNLYYQGYTQTHGKATLTLGPPT